MRGLREKVAIVTGGAAGIGCAIARRFAREEAFVVVADLNEDGARQVAHEIGGDKRCLPVRTDIADEQSVEEMIRQSVDRFGRLDILINCAARFVMRGVDASVEEWLQALKTNVIGSALCVKHALPHMRKGRQGSIVNVCSISAIIAQPQFVTYSACKGALLTMTKCMALDLASDGIRVNAVSPGTVWTSGNADFIARSYGVGRAEADRHPEIGGAHVLGRTADPEEVASAVAFLASDEASFITGENLMVDGGYTVR